MIDASILQGVRPLDFKIPSQVDSYKNALALQGGMTQNALAQYTLAKAQRDDAETEAFNRALRSADLSTPEGRAAAQRAAMSAAPTKGIGFANQLLEQETKRATLDKTRAETAKQLADQAARMIANAKTDQEMDQAFQFWSRGNPEQASVVRNQYMAARQSGARVPDLAPKIASLFSEDVLKQIKAFAPEVKPQDVGGTVQFVNTNTLAGPVGPVQGVNALTKTLTPEGAETVRHNKVMEPIAQGNLDVNRGQLQETKRHNPVMEGLQQTNNNQSAISSLRKEFNDLPEVKNYRSVIPIINSAVNAPDTRAGDIQMAYTIGKIFDPNSVVREGELKLVGDAATALQKFEGELRTLTQGKGRLIPQTRAELIGAAQARVKEIEAANNAAKATYEKAAMARGLPADQIFIDMPQIKQAKPPTDAAIRISGDAEYNALPKGAVYIGPDGVKRKKP